MSTQVKKIYMSLCLMRISKCDMYINDYIGISMCGLLYIDSRNIWYQISVHMYLYM